MREEGKRAKKGSVTTVVSEGNWGSDPLGVLTPQGYPTCGMSKVVCIYIFSLCYWLRAIPRGINSWPAFDWTKRKHPSKEF